MSQCGTTTIMVSLREKKRAKRVSAASGTENTTPTSEHLALRRSRREKLIDLTSRKASDKALQSIRGIFSEFHLAVNVFEPELDAG